MDIKHITSIALLTSIFALTGCNTPKKKAEVPVTPIAFEDRAIDGLKRAITYEPITAVRVQAVEAFAQTGCEQGLPWIRASLLDTHPAVRFAACVALGEMRDVKAKDRLTELIADEDRSVQLAAIYALHRLSDTQYTGRLPDYLLYDEDSAVRRNAAFVLGRMEEKGVVKMLARTMKDKDGAVRQIALESMARLGNIESREQLVFRANSGVGEEEVLALLALADLREPILYDVFLNKLETATHLETKLSAVRGIGLLGRTEGYDLALGALDFNKPIVRDERDSEEKQIFRVRQLAMAALGAIGKREALPELNRVLLANRDPQEQVAAARAILEIMRENQLGEKPLKGNPFMTP